MAGARNSGDWPEAGTSWELGLINLNVHFFLQVREFFVLHRMVGRTRRGVLTPGYFGLFNFPSQWDFPGKNIGEGCHFLLQGIFQTQEMSN